MKKTLLIMICMLGITSCSSIRVHKMNVEQGNITTPEMIHHLHKGMSQQQVRDVMGTPLLKNTFDNNRLDYVYTYKPGYGEFKEKLITLIFKNGTLKDITHTHYPLPQ